MRWTAPLFSHVSRVYAPEPIWRMYSNITRLPERNGTIPLSAACRTAAYRTCIYCNHCQPCPSGIDIGSLNKYMDLAKVGDELAKNHYMKSSKNANDCNECGACEKNCPFHVDIRSKMREAKIILIS